MTADFKLAATKITFLRSRSVPSFYKKVELHRTNDANDIHHVVLRIAAEPRDDRFPRCSSPAMA
jgi:hypothetical protein